MRLAHLTLAAAALLAVAVPCALSQEVIETDSGQTFTGRIVSNDGTSLEFETTAGATMTLPLARLTPETQFHLRRATAAPDGKGQLELAEWCVDMKLYQQAKACFRKALEVDPLMSDEINARIVTARTKAANELLARAKGLQASGKPQEARRLLSLLVQELPLEEASQEAARMLAQETDQRKQDSLARGAGPAAPGGADAPAPDDGTPRRSSGEAFSEATRTLFQPIVDSYHKLLDASQAGLVKGGSAGIAEFEKALKEGDRIRKAADKLQPMKANDPEIAEALALVDSRLEEAVVDVRINLADAYMLRTSYNQAAEAVRLGLADYPRNERLRQAMNQVTAASADNGGGAWVIGGVRGR